MFSRDQLDNNSALLELGLVGLAKCAVRVRSLKLGLCYNLQ